MRPFQPALRIALSMASVCSQPWSGATSGRYVADKVRRAAKGDDEEGEEVRGRERSETAEESGEGASEAVGLVEGGLNEICMPWVPTVQSRYDAASSKSVRSDTLAPPRGNIPERNDDARKPTRPPKIKH